MASLPEPTINQVVAARSEPWKAKEGPGPDFAQLTAATQFVFQIQLRKQRTRLKWLSQVSIGYGWWCTELVDRDRERCRGNLHRIA